MLCMAMAMAMGMAMFTSFRAARNVTIPSGKLWIATAFSFKKYCSSLVIVVKMLIFVHSDAEAPP